MILLINGLPVVQIELKALGINPRRPMEQIVEYRNDPGNGYTNTLLCFMQIFIVSNRENTWYFANNHSRHFVLTGKRLAWGGSLIRPEATGYGCVYFTQEMLKTRNDTLQGKTCVVSGSGNVAQYTVEKLLELGARVVAMSDSNGYIYDPAGIDTSKLNYIMDLKNIRRGRIREYTQKFGGEYVEGQTPWEVKCDCAFPSATQNEISAADAQALLDNGCTVVAEDANMPTIPEGVAKFINAGILYGPGKAANAGGVATSALEMSQNSGKISWTREEVDRRLKQIMQSIHQQASNKAEEYGFPGNYVIGANIAGFMKVSDAMLEQGVV